MYDPDESLEQQAEGLYKGLAFPLVNRTNARFRVDQVESGGAIRQNIWLKGTLVVVLKKGENAPRVISVEPHKAVIKWGDTGVNTIDNETIYLLGKVDFSSAEAPDEIAKLVRPVLDDVRFS